MKTTADITDALAAYVKEFDGMPPLLCYTANEIEALLRKAIKTGQPLKEKSHGR